MAKHRHTDSSDAHVNVDGSTARKSKKSFLKSKWALIAAFVVVFGGLGSAFLYGSFADEQGYKNVAAYSNQYCPNTSVQCTTYQMGITRILSTSKADGSAQYYAWAELEPGKTLTTQKTTVSWVEIDRLDFGVPTKSFTAVTDAKNSTGTVAASTAQGLIVQSDLPSMEARLTFAVHYTNGAVLTYTTGALKYTQFSNPLPTVLPNPNTAPPSSSSTGFKTSAPAPTPAPATKTPTPTPVKPTPAPTSSTTAPTPQVMLSTKDNDGCGKNASHYSGTVHVGQTNYGTNSVCKCTNSTVSVSYAKLTKPLLDTQVNTYCPATDGGGGGQGGQGGQGSTIKAIPPSQGNDGCGANATHYSSTGKHVGQTNYGNGSICKCNNQKIVSYGKPYNDSTSNPGCVLTAIDKPDPDIRRTQNNRYNKTCLGAGGRVVNHKCTITNYTDDGPRTSARAITATQSCLGTVPNHPNDCVIK